jgi:hypothetical protein
VPWISEGVLRTDLLLNSWQEPLARRRGFEVQLSQYGPMGECLDQMKVAVTRTERTLVPLAARGSATYGMCVIEPDGCGQHIQISDGRSFAITHGRTGQRLYRCARLGQLNRLARRFLRPYKKNFNALVRHRCRVELLVFNQSDDACFLSASARGRRGRASLGTIQAFGALRVDPAESALGLGPSFVGMITLHGSAPFDYYVLARADGPGGPRHSIQHVK